MELEIRNVYVGSECQDSLPWMKVERELMPVTRYDQLTTDKVTESEIEKECFDEQFLLSAQTYPLIKYYWRIGPGRKQLSGKLLSYWLIPLGLAGLRIINIVLLFLTNTMFRASQKREQQFQEEKEHRGFKTRSTIEFPNHGKQVLHRYESEVIRAKLKPKQLESFIESNGIFFLGGRVEKENPFRFINLEKIPFLDAPKIT